MRRDPSPLPGVLRSSTTPNVSEAEVMRSSAVTRAATSVAVLLAAFASAAEAQERIVSFGNAMQSTVDIVAIPVGGTERIPLTIGQDGIVQFRFTGQRFNLQVIPRDERDSGFRFANVDLSELAANSSDG